MPRKPKKLFGVAAIGTVAAAAVMLVVPGAPNPVEAIESPPLMACSTMENWVCNCGEDCLKINKCNLVSGGDPFEQECELIPE